MEKKNIDLERDIKTLKSLLLDGSKDIFNTCEEIYFLLKEYGEDENFGYDPSSFISLKDYKSYPRVSRGEVLESRLAKILLSIDSRTPKENIFFYSVLYGDIRKIALLVEECISNKEIKEFDYEYLLFFLNFIDEIKKIEEEKGLKELYSKDDIKKVYDVASRIRKDINKKVNQ